MNAPVALTSLLLGRLRQRLVSGQALGEGLSFCTHQAHTLRSLSLDGALMAVPVQGHKRVRQSGEADIFIYPGELLLVPGACQADVENVPTPEGAPYLALGMLLSPTVLDAGRLLWAEPPGRRSPPGPACTVRLDDTLAQHLWHWCQASEAGQPALAQHALVGLVLALCERGHTGVLHPPAPTLAARIRTLVGAEPARPWSSADLEARLGLSGATLRRHLAAEGTGLRDVLVDARLAHALGLLYASPMPLKTVAARVGYTSVASFAHRFTLRYGVAPGEVGHARV